MRRESLTVSPLRRASRGRERGAVAGGDAHQHHRGRRAAPPPRPHPAPRLAGALEGHVNSLAGRPMAPRQRPRGLQAVGQGLGDPQREAPAARATWSTSRPMGPQPKTPTAMPGRRWARSTACSATPSGSSRAPAAALTLPAAAAPGSASARPRTRAARRPRRHGRRSASVAHRLGWPARHILAFLARHSRVHRHHAGHRASGRQTRGPGHQRPLQPGDRRWPPSAYQCRSEPHIPTA